MEKVVGICYNQHIEDIDTFIKYSLYLFILGLFFLPFPKERKKNMTKETKKRVPIMKKFEELTYSDSFLFGEVMLDEETSKNVLEIILNVKIEKVVIIEKEKQVDSAPDCKSIRLDIYVQDGNNTVYNIEMQVENKHDTPKRSRYYQGLLDTKILPSGAKDYNLLKDSYIIFICQFDPFELGKCYYTFEERCMEETTLALGDGAKKIFLNTGGENRAEMTEDMRDFLDYVKNPDSTKIKSEKVKAIDNRVNKVKADAEVRSKYMTLANWIEEKCDEARELAMEEGRAEGREEGRLEGHSTGLQEGKTESKVELIHAVYRKGYDVAKTVEIFELEKSFVEKVYELFQTYPEESDEQITRRYLEI